MEAKFTMQSIKQIYSGKTNACCCGCSGKHYDAGTPAFDKMAAKVLKLFNAPGANIDTVSSDCFALEINEKRMYVIYLS